MAAVIDDRCGPEEAERGWRGELSLALAPRAGRTVLVRRRHRGPFVVQRPFYPEGAVCHVVLLHPPGGVVGGDILALDVAVAAGAHGLLTTPAATKLYRSAGPECRIAQRLAIAAGGVLEWLPQETIVFERAEARLETRVDLEDGAAFIGWEVTCLGRPACGEGFAVGTLAQSFELWRGAEPLVLDRARWAGGAAPLGAPWGLGAMPVTATLLATPVPEDAAGLAREAAGPERAARFAASRVDGVLVARYVGPSAAEARAVFAAVWAALRPAMLDRAACAPRIWAT